MNISDYFSSVPIHALSEKCKEKLKFLDCTFIIPDTEVKLRDYRGLAVLLNYSTLELNYLIDQKRYTSPTYLILDRMKMEKRTFLDLYCCLKKLKRSDIIDNCREELTRDAMEFLKKTGKFLFEHVNQEAFKQITSPTELDEAKKTIGKLFTTDIIETANRQIDIYDVFISFESESIDDIKIMWLISGRLESRGLTVAKGSYSFIQGVCINEAFANAIYNRSKKVILLISKAFINSESCLMQLNFARDADRASRRNKIIPVYIEEVKKPECIASINGFNYYNNSIREMFFDSFINSF